MATVLLTAGDGSIELDPSPFHHDGTKISVEGVSKEFGATENPFVALQSVDIQVRDGEFLSLLGPSGCGKSTLLEIIAGLQTATSGVVRMDNVPIQGPGPQRAVVFQHYALLPWRTVIRNIELPMELAGMKQSERREQAMEFLHLVGLERFGDRHVWQLSGGMQQRVALARALACKPEVLLMDEPFSGADAITREVLQDQLLKLQRATRKTVIFVTHSVDEAIQLSHRVVVLGTRPGRVVDTFKIDDKLRADATKIAQLREQIWSVLRREIIVE